MTLKKIVKLEREARNFGFDWPNKEMIFDQIISEIEEIKQAKDSELQEEVGDLLHAVISLCIFLNYDLEETLGYVVTRF